MVEAGRSPVLPAETLRALGFAIAIYPGTGFCAMAAALHANYAHIVATGSSLGGPTPLWEIPKVHELMGFEEIWAFEKKWAD